MSYEIIDRIRGMLLLGAYGDAMGAGHEGSTEILEPPFPKPLPERQMPTRGSAWGTWLPNRIASSLPGVSTDDTAFRMFILHPWLQSIALGQSSFTEDAFREFIVKLLVESPQPEWATAPRNTQIDAWIEMFQAQEESRCIFFFCPDVAIVFGLFMYLETAATFQSSTSLKTYEFFRGFSRLDQRYAKSATAFMATLLNTAVERDPSLIAFDEWFLEHSNILLGELKPAFPNDTGLAVLGEMFPLMQALGAQYKGSSEEAFVSAFKELVIDPTHPPFMDEPFSGVFDPFRFIAQIVATVAYSAGDPAVAIRAIAYSVGDTDTTASFLGSLMGVWYGETQLRAFETPDLVLNDELDIIEDVLVNLFKIDLDERASLFKTLRDAAAPKFA